MPADLTRRPTDSMVEVRDRTGTGLPFSRGVMATSILATGLETEHAYRIAVEIQDEVARAPCQTIDADELARVSERVILRKAGPDAARRYRAWRHAKRLGRPVFIALAGAPGVGKSTLATRLAVRLGITRVVTTDTIREVLRTVIPRTVLPELHVSTHEVAMPEAAGDSSLASFYRQARAVGAATAAVVNRLAAERRSAIVEGAHVIPGQLTSQLEDREANPVMVELLLTLSDEKRHAAYLRQRAQGEPARGSHRQLHQLDKIRALQVSLQEVAAVEKVDEYDVANPADLTQLIVDQIVAKTAANRERQDEG